MVCAMVCLSDDLIYSNILALFLVVFLCGSFGFGIPRFAQKPYGRHLSLLASVLVMNFGDRWDPRACIWECAFIANRAATRVEYI